MTLTEHWQHLSEDNPELHEDFMSQNEKEPFPPFFFHYFRPDGKGLEPYFSNYRYGSEIFSRVREVYEATAAANLNYAYFIVENPKLLTKQQLIKLGEQYIRSMKTILAEMEEPEVLSAGSIAVTIIKGSCPETAHDNETAQDIYDIKGDYFRSFSTDSEFMHLHYCDCIYYMACSYDLVYHILWPLVSDQSKTEDLYAACFDLWKYGAEAVFSDPRTLCIYVNDFISEPS